jgi:uncharacterized phiE125 gp8 family phage protein
MKYAVTTAPTVEPVTLADAKVHLRTVTGDTSEDAAVITPLITAAREYCENVTGRALAAQTVKAYPEAWGLWRLPRPPFSTITSIKYYDLDDTETTLAAADYQVDAVDGLVLILEEPAVTLRELNPIVVEYAAGAGTIPMAVRQAMLLLIAHWYQNREAVQADLSRAMRVGSVSREVDYSVARLLSQYKVWWS